MAKITQLPLEPSPDGSETVVMVKDNVTRRAALGGIVGAAVAPHVAAAQLARDQAADMVEVQRIFVDLDIAEAEATTVAGQFFKLVDSAAGTAAVYRRTASGSEELYQEATAAALASPDPGKGGAMLGFSQSDAAAVARTISDKLSESVSVKDFGVTGLGVSNDTAAVVLANLFSLAIIFPAGGTYNLQNWVPRAGTRIIATGATINRYDDTTYGGTGSSAAVVITNDDIEIVGGTWGKSPLATKSISWTGSVLVENGLATIRGATFKDTWGAVFGNNLQNGNKVCSYLQIEGCSFDNNSHNTYLADIENLSFVNNHSRNASRDGLRVYRNVANLIITGNHLYNNGDGTGGQSQDGMDLFFGGKRCVITDNFVYGNFMKGIDIKRGLAAEGEAVYGERFIIQGNHIFDNGYSGIEFAQSQTTPAYNENVQILGNQIYGNGQYGIAADYCKNLMISSNLIHSNLNHGMRLSNVIVGHIKDNILYDNTGLAILAIPTCSNIEVTGNTAYDRGGGTQTGGINISCSGRCFGNRVYGHSGAQIASTVSDGSLKGEKMFVRVDSGISGLQYIGTPGKYGAVTGAKLAVGAGATVDFLIGKRNASTGAFVGALYSNAAEVLTGNLPAQLTAGSWNATHSRVSDNELLYVVINGASSSFTSGLVELDVIT